MSKRKKKSKKNKERQPARWPREKIPPTSWKLELEQAINLLEKDKPEEALSLLEPLLPLHPNNFNLWATAVIAYYQTGQIWEAVIAAHQVQQGKGGPAHWVYTLAWLYTDTFLYELAYRALQKGFRKGAPPTDPDEWDDLKVLAKSLEEELQNFAAAIEKPLSRVHKGRYFYEEAQIALHQSRPDRAISFYRKAIRLLGEKFPVAYNELSTALYIAGFPDKAIDTARQVLQTYPDNIHALSILTIFLKHTGRGKEAQDTWERLKEFTASPSNEAWSKLVETATVMGDDQAVYDLLQHPPTKEAREITEDWPLGYYRAIAEANLGKRKAAIRHLRPWKDISPFIHAIWEALQEGRKSLGFTDHFPYLGSLEIVPHPAVETLMEMEEAKTPPSKSEGKRLIQHYPQIVLALKQMIWEENSIEPAINIAKILNQPEAYAVLEEFALGQEGNDEDRLDVLLALQAAGYIPPGKPIRFWRGGKWVKVEGHTTTLVEEEEELPYSPSTILLLEHAITLAKEGKKQEAKKAFEQILEQEPNVKEAYNNLASLVIQEGDLEQAKALLRKALEVDPNYSLATINLARLTLAEDKGIEKANHLLDGLLRRGKISPSNMAHVAYLKAHIAIRHGDFDAALSQINTALMLDPENPTYEQALSQIEMLQTAKQFFAQAHKREQIKRARRRQKINTIDPTLEQALSLYIRDELGSIARATNIPQWYKLRKAELLEKVIETLQSSETLATLVTYKLDARQREALQYVLEAGGATLLEDFMKHFATEDDERANNLTENTLLTPLEDLGLLVETQLEDNAFVCIPMELRPLLKRALSENTQ